jgi:hypothetical protein
VGSENRLDAFGILDGSLEILEISENQRNLDKIFKNNSYPFYFLNFKHI